MYKINELIIIQTLNIYFVQNIALLFFFLTTNKVRFHKIDVF